MCIRDRINIIYGALCAMAQKDFKRLIAYSSISHMGYVMLGMASLNSIGISGAVLQMFNHGTITAISTLGILLGAGYMLWTLQRIYLGTVPEKWKVLKDLDFREYAMLVPLSVIIIFLGVYPSSMLILMNSSVNAMVKFMMDSKALYSSIT